MELYCKKLVFQERFVSIWGHSKNSLAGKGGGCLKANKNKQENGTSPIQTFVLENR